MFSKEEKSNDQNKEQSLNDDKNSLESNNNNNNTSIAQEELTVSKLFGSSPTPKKNDLFASALSGNSIGFTSYVKQNLFLTPAYNNASIFKNDDKLNRPPTLAAFCDNDLFKTNKLTNIDTLLQSIGGDFSELTNNHQFTDFFMANSQLGDTVNNYGNFNHFNIFMNDDKDLPSKMKDSTNLLNSSIIHKEYFQKQLELFEQQNKLKEEQKAKELNQQNQNNQKLKGQGDNGDGEQTQNGENDSDNINDSEQKSKEGCRCKNSKCLKLYCECFAKGAYCRDICKCLQCSNKEECEAEIKEARKATLTRNPDAFTSKLEVVGTIAQDQDIDANKGMLGYKKGCKCTKTYCKKKYCECYNAGVHCSYLCICKNCHNVEQEDEEKQPKDATSQIPNKNNNYSGKVNGNNNNNDGKVSSDQSLEYNTQQYSLGKKKIKTNQSDENDSQLNLNNQNGEEQSNNIIRNIQFTPNFSINDKTINLDKGQLKNIQYSDFNFNS